MSESIPITKNGYDKLKSTLDKLKRVDRVQIADAIAVAREHGDLSENSEYISAREQQAHIEDKITHLEGVLSRVNIIDVEMLSGDNVMFGAVVTIMDEDTNKEFTYQIVSEYESDINNGLISNKSPIGRALIGKMVGDSISYEAPNGYKYFEILNIEYGTNRK